LKKKTSRVFSFSLPPPHSLSLFLLLFPCLNLFSPSSPSCSYCYSLLLFFFLSSFFPCHQVEKYGSRWRTVGEMVGRHADQCRDKYRELVHPANERWGKTWTEGEEQQLLELMRAAMKLPGDTDVLSMCGMEVPWSTVVKRMGSRGRIACIKKWDQLQSRARHAHNLARGSSRDATDLSLVQEVLATGANDETEITWSKLSHYRSAY
ncbi:unnamed protein product, partial [Discosporangium mesarthrocarpum]